MNAAWPDGWVDDERRRLVEPPANEAPALVAVGSVLARTEHSAVLLAGLQVYTTGIGFTVSLLCRPEALGPGLRDLGDVLWGRGSAGAQLLLGLELADGRRVTNLPGARHPGGGNDRERLVLSHRGGSGGQLSADQSWWLSPLPPDGPLRLVVRCDQLGLAETVTELDGTAIRAAAAGVVTLWPWVSPREAELEQPPPPPDVPVGSWFARG